jgi:PhnB protein
MFMMMNKKVAPEGSTVLCPYLMVESVEAQIDFLVKVFGAQVTEDAKRSDGFIQHGEVLIGDTNVMIGRSSKDFPSRQSMNYVYVADVDDIHRQALNAGAVEIMPPADRFYGIRESGFTDPHGNQWWPAQIIEQLSKEDLHKRTSSL